MCNTARHQDQLLHVNACSALMTGMQADVDWYIGGNAYVNLPTAVAEVPNGVYLAKTKWYTLKGCPDEEVGPETATASISNLRWIGTTGEVTEMIMASQKELGKRKYNRLVEMLTINCGSSQSEDVDMQCSPQSRHLDPRWGP